MKTLDEIKKDNYNVNSIGIFDNNIENPCDDGTLLLSNVSVLVEIVHNEETLYFEYQTSTSYDCAVSKTLSVYKHDNFNNNNECLANFVLENEPVQLKFDEYIEENYIENDDHFGGIDANSVHDKIIAR
jgi:hypothetical protein